MSDCLDRAERNLLDWEAHRDAGAGRSAVRNVIAHLRSLTPPAREVIKPDGSWADDPRTKIFARHFPGVEACRCYSFLAEVDLRTVPQAGHPLLSAPPPNAEDERAIDEVMRSGRVERKLDSHKVKLGRYCDKCKANVSASEQGYCTQCGRGTHVVWVAVAPESKKEEPADPSDLGAARYFAPCPCRSSEPSIVGGYALSCAICDTPSRIDLNHKEGWGHVTPCDGHLTAKKEEPAGPSDEWLKFTGTDHTEDANRLAAAFGIVGERFSHEASEALMTSYIAGEKDGRASLAAELDDWKRWAATLAPTGVVLPKPTDVREFAGARVAQIERLLATEQVEHDRHHGVEDQLRAVLAEKDRIQELEARVAAWKPVVVWALISETRTTASERAHQIAAFADAIPPELRPGEKA